MNGWMGSSLPHTEMGELFFYVLDDCINKQKYRNLSHFFSLPFLYNPGSLYRFIVSVSVAASQLVDICPYPLPHYQLGEVENICLFAACQPGGSSLFAEV